MTATLEQGFRRAVLALRQRFCSHVFVVADLQARDAEGMVTWPCSKCGKVHRMEYGLLAPGTIVGPWTHRP